MGGGAAAILLGLIGVAVIGGGLVPSLDDILDRFEDDDDPRANGEATELSDALSLGDGGDTISGGAGNDVISAGAGNDAVRGGSGADILRGEKGFDVLEGNSGPDLLYGGEGRDVLDGGSSPDRLDGQDGADLIFGGDGGDLIDGGAGDDTLAGGDGADTLRGGDGADTLTGGGWYGGEVDYATLLAARAGTAPDPQPSADAAPDTLEGGAGDDVLLLGPEDRATGGDGADLFQALFQDAPAEQAVIRDYDPTEDRIAVGYVGDVPPEVTVEDDGAGNAVVRTDGIAAMLVEGAAGLTAGEVELIRTDAPAAPETPTGSTGTPSPNAASAPDTIVPTA
ncbi:MAG: calcium-binding protein [Shimia sp.]